MVCICPAIGASANYDDDTSLCAIWRLVEFPKTKRLCRKLKGRILLFDEEQLPFVSTLSKRPESVLCAIDGRGTLHFSVTQYPVTAGKRTDFMERLILDIGRPIVLLLYSHPNHRNVRICKWQRVNAERITLVHIPITNLRNLPAECWPFGGTHAH